MPATLAIRDERDGEYTITLEYNHDGKKAKQSTGYKVAKKYWDNQNKRIKQNGVANVTEANLTLGAKLKNWNDILDRLEIANSNIAPTVDAFKAELASLVKASKAKPVKETPLASILEGYLTNRTKWQPATRTNFKTLLSNILEYENATGVTWLLSTLTNSEIDNFQKWLVKELKLANSTLGKRHKLLKHFLNKYPAPHVNQRDNSPLYDVALTPPQVLDKSEIKALEELELDPQSRLGKVRNVFLLQIFTGLRYGDLARLAPHHIHDEQIEIIEGKTDQRRIIPLFPQAEAVLALYGEGKHSFTLPVISPQKFNKYLKELTATMPVFKKKIGFTELIQDTKTPRVVAKCELIESHTARRTFCTLLLSMGYSVTEVMGFSGHNTVSSFSRYVGKIETRKDIVSDFKARYAAL